MQADLSLKMAGPDTIIIPGHGPAATRAELEEYGRDARRQSAITSPGSNAKARIAMRSLRQGHRRTYDAKWGQFLIDPAFFTRLVYDGL